MNRRDFLLGAGATVGTLGAGAGALFVFTNNGKGDKDRVVTGDDIPPKVKEVRPLAEEFYREITKHKNATVYLTEKGEIAMEYTSDAESREALLSEFRQIADVYANVIKEGEHEPVTLSLIVGEVQGIVPVTSLRAYIDDRINQRGFLETIEVTGVQRESE